MGWLTVLALIVLDVASGAILAISRWEFDVRKLPDFLRQSVLPYIGGLVILAVGSTFSPEVNALYVASVAAASGKPLAAVLPGAMVLCSSCRLWTKAEPPREDRRRQPPND